MPLLGEQLRAWKERIERGGIMVVGNNISTMGQRSWRNVLLFVMQLLQLGSPPFPWDTTLYDLLRRYRQLPARSRNHPPSLPTSSSQHTLRCHSRWINLLLLSNPNNKEWCRPNVHNHNNNTVVVSVHARSSETQTVFDDE